MLGDDCSNVKHITSTKEEFAGHLKRASEIVQSWPKWKQTGKIDSTPQGDGTQASQGDE